jgi:hypothetical protein
MSGLDYPFAYSCSCCDREITIERSDARGLYSDPDSSNAPKVVLEQRRWVRGQVEGDLFCPDCAGTREVNYSEHR